MKALLKAIRRWLVDQLFRMLFPSKVKHIKFLDYKIKGLEGDVLEYKYHLTKVCSANRAEANRWRGIIKRQLLS